MKQFIFAVHDSAAGAFIPPFTLPTEAMAIRTFAECAHNHEHQFCKFPNDFCLYLVGEFDDSTGVVQSYATHKNLGLAASFQVKVQSSDLFELEGSN